MAGHVDVRVHRRLQQPVSFGLRQPVIVVPLALMRQPAEIQIAAILHECVHVARRDWVGLLVEQMLCAVLWFHPAIWWAIDRLQLAREQLVDATVVRRMGGHRAYARALLLFADRPAPAMASTLFRGHMRQRIAALAVRRPFAPARLAAASACLVAVTAAATANAAAMGSAAQRGDMVYSAGNGVSLPAVVTEVQPTYTRDAMRAKIQGRVALACVVDARGVPGRIEILTSLDREHGLDRSAVDALKQWRFKPGTKDGKPVPVRITVEMTFTLK